MAKLTPHVTRKRGRTPEFRKSHSVRDSLAFGASNVGREGTKWVGSDCGLWSCEYGFGPFWRHQNRVSSDRLRPSLLSRFEALQSSRCRFAHFLPNMPPQKLAAFHGILLKWLQIPASTFFRRPLDCIKPCSPALLTRTQAWHAGRSPSRLRVPPASETFPPRNPHDSTHLAGNRLPRIVLCPRA